MLVRVLCEPRGAMVFSRTPGRFTKGGNGWPEPDADLRRSTSTGRGKWEAQEAEGQSSRGEPTPRGVSNEDLGPNFVLVWSDERGWCPHWSDGEGGNCSDDETTVRGPHKRKRGGLGSGRQRRETAERGKGGLRPLLSPMSSDTDKGVGGADWPVGGSVDGE